MKQILLLSTILIFAASCVSNPETSSLASNEQEEKDGRICKQEEVLGSKIPQKICYTKAEIEDMERSGQNAIENERRRRMDQQTQQGLRNTGEPIYSFRLLVCPKKSCFNFFILINVVIMIISIIEVIIWIN